MAPFAIACCWRTPHPWIGLPAIPLIVSNPFSLLALTLAFALTAWGMRAVTFSGAFAGLLITGFICLGAGLPAFFTVFTVFVLTFIATRLGYPRTQHLGAAEHHEGRRASQIFANLGAAAMGGAPMLFFPSARGL